MAKKNKSIWTPWSLFGLSAVLLSAGWLMKPFPILIFVGFAPLFAILDYARDSKNPWNRFELILLALTISLFAASFFDFQIIITVLVQAIVLTLTFVGYSFAYQNLGSRLGKFTVIFFWLGLEFVLLNLPWREQTIFLADSLSLVPDWIRWTNHSGYLGASLWILSVNLVFYLSFFHIGTFNLYLFIFAILLIGIPIVLSYQMDTLGVNRAQMISFSNESNILQEKFTGELVARTAAWVSVLIILLAFVKNQTKKK
jgi:apolipoprotein N-acyltransferase